MKQYLEYPEDNPTKFWEIELDGQLLHIQYGKIGTQGRSSHKDLHIKEKALEAFKKEVIKKKKKGYFDPQNPILKLPLEATPFNNDTFKHRHRVVALQYLPSADLVLSVCSDTFYLWTTEGTLLDTFSPTASDYFFGAIIIKQVPHRQEVLLLRSNMGKKEEAFYWLDYSQNKLTLLRQHTVELDASTYHRQMDLNEQHIYFGYTGGFELLDYNFETIKTIPAPTAKDSSNATFVCAASQRVVFGKYGNGELDTLIVMDVKGQEITRFQAPAHTSSEGMMVQFDQTGKKLYTCTSFNYATKAQVWDLDQGTCLQELTNYSSSSGVLSFHPSPDDKHLLIRMAGIDLILWDLENERVAWVKQNQTSMAHSAFGKQGSYYQSAGNRIQRMSLADGSPQHIIKGLSSNCQRLYFDAIQQRLWVLSGNIAHCFNLDGSVHRTLDITDFVAGILPDKMLTKRRYQNHGGSYAWLDFATDEETPILSDRFNSIDYNDQYLLTTTGYFSNQKKMVRLWSHSGKLRQATKPIRQAEAVLWREHHYVLTRSKNIEFWEIGAPQASLVIKRAHKKSGIVLLGRYADYLLSHTDTELKLWDGVSALAVWEEQAEGSILTVLPLDQAFLVVTQEGGLYRLDLADLELTQVARLGQPIEQATLTPEGRLYVSTTETEILQADGSAFAKTANPVKKRPTTDWSALEQMADSAALLEWLPTVDWKRLTGEQFLALRVQLQALEAKEGQVSAAHHYFTEQLLQAGATLRHEFTYEEAIGSYALSPDGAYLAVGTWLGDHYEEDGTLQIWELATGRCVNLLQEQYGGIGWPDYYHMIQWSPDSRYLGATINTNGVAKFNPFSASATPLAQAYITDGWSRPPAWTWLGDQDQFAISCWHQSEIPLALTSNKNLRSYEDNAEGMAPKLAPAIQAALTRGDLQPYHYCSSTPKGDWVVGYNQHQQLFAIDLHKRQVAWLQSAHWPIAFHPIRETLAYHQEGQLTLADMRTGEAIATLDNYFEASGLQFSPDGQYLAAYRQNHLALFQQQQSVATLILDAPLLQPRDSSSELQPLCFSPSGDRVAVLLQGQQVQIWTIEGAILETSFEVAQAQGLYWGDSLVAVGTYLVAFYQADGRLIHRCDKQAQVNAYNVLYDQERPLVGKQYDFSTRSECSPYYPFYENKPYTWLAATSTGVVIHPNATVEQLDRHLAYVFDFRYAWPYRWGGNTSRYPDLYAAKDDPKLALSPREKALLQPAPKKEAKEGSVPLTKAGSPLDLVALYQQSLSQLGKGWGYHITKYNGKIARKLVTLSEWEAALTLAKQGNEWYKKVSNLGWVATDLASKGETQWANKAFEAGVAALEAGDATTREGWAATFVYAPLAAAAQLLGQPAVSEQYFEAAHQQLNEESNPNEKYAHLASAYLLSGQLDQAMQTMNVAPRTGHFTDYQAAFVQLLVRQGHAPAAMQYLQQWIEEFGSISNFELLHAGVRVLSGQRHYAEAQAWMDLFDNLSKDQAYDILLEQYRQNDDIKLATNYLLQMIEQAKGGNFKATCIWRLADFDAAAARQQLKQLLANPLKVYYFNDYCLCLGKVYNRVGWIEEGLRQASMLKAAQQPYLLRGLLDEFQPASADLQKTALHQLLPLLSEQNLSGAQALNINAKLAVQADALGEATTAEQLVQQVRDLADQYKTDGRALMPPIGLYVAYGWLEEAHLIFKKMTPAQRKTTMRSFAKAVAEAGYYKAAAALLKTLPAKDLNDRPSATVTALGII